MGGNISVIFDSQDCEKEHMLQVVSKARSLVEKTEQKVVVFCAHSMDESMCQLLFRYGADEIVHTDKEQELEIIQVVDTSYDMVKKYQPGVILVPATERGKAVAAALSVKLEAGLTADCIDIDFDESGELYFERAAINDSVIAKIQGLNSPIQMGTVKKDVFCKKEYEHTGNGNVIIESCRELEERYLDAWNALETERIESTKKIDINAYKTVFAIGRGVQDKALYDRICALAEHYNAGIVGTRAVVEEGLMERERQVGQSGKSISPNVYVSFGVSGASQHIVGIKNVGTMIAVNSDKNAKIFEYADYAIVEDLEKIVEKLEHLAK